MKFSSGAGINPHQVGKKKSYFKPYKYIRDMIYYHINKGIYLYKYSIEYNHTKKIVYSNKNLFRDKMRKIIS